jgi:hypothetical protein
MHGLTAESHTDKDIDDEMQQMIMVRLDRQDRQ